MASRMGLWSEVFEGDILGGGGGWREQRAFQGQRWELEFKIQDATVYIKNDSF